MKKSLADLMRKSHLNLESGDKPIEVKATLSTDKEEQVIALPTAARPDSVEATIESDTLEEGATVDDAVRVIRSTDENGEDVVRAVIVTRPIDGSLRIRFTPSNGGVTMEDGNDVQPFVLIAVPTAPGEEPKNPYPANAPTETPAPKVTNDPTVNADRDNLKNKIQDAANAIDPTNPAQIEQAAQPAETTEGVKGNVVEPEKAEPVAETAAAAAEVTPETKTTEEPIKVTVIKRVVEKVEKVEDTVADEQPVVDANDGNTGEQKAEAVAQETELQGDVDVDSADETSTEDSTTEPAAEEATNTDADADATDTTATEGDDDEDDENEEDEDLKQESFEIHQELEARGVLDVPVVEQRASVILGEGEADVTVIETEQPYIPGTMVVRRLDGDKSVIVRRTRYAERFNADGQGEAIAIVDPTLQGELKMEFRPADGPMESFEIRPEIKDEYIMESYKQLDVALNSDLNLEDGDKQPGRFKQILKSVYEAVAKFLKALVARLKNLFGVNKKKIEEKANKLTKEQRTAPVMKLLPPPSDTKKVDVEWNKLDTLLANDSKSVDKIVNAVKDSKRIADASKKYFDELKNSKEGEQVQHPAEMKAALGMAGVKAFGYSIDDALNGIREFRDELSAMKQQDDAVPSNVSVEMLIDASTKLFDEDLLKAATQLQETAEQLLRDLDKVENESGARYVTQRTRTLMNFATTACTVYGFAAKELGDVTVRILTAVAAADNGDLKQEEYQDVAGENDPVVTIETLEGDAGTRVVAEAEIVDDPAVVEFVERAEEAQRNLAIGRHAVSAVEGILVAAREIGPDNFQGNVEATEIAMEGFMDTVKSAVNRIGNWIETNHRYYTAATAPWDKLFAETQQALAKARRGNPAAERIILKRFIRHLTIGGEPITDVKKLIAALGEIKMLGNMARELIVAIDRELSEVRKSNQSETSAGSVVGLKRIPIQKWDKLMVATVQPWKDSDRKGVGSKAYLGETHIVKMSATYATTRNNPNEEAAKLMQWIYTGINRQFTVSDDLTSEELPVASTSELEALLRAAREAHEAWLIADNAMQALRSIDKFLDSELNVENDVNNVVNYGIVLGLEDWLFHPALTLWQQFNKPMQAVLFLIKAHCGAYK
ncbi:hypothetical protein BGN33_05280 [Salmonella enterica subsp. enterica serovar Enteritidis]|nr:hypothetical protein [Salmonella enterica subsp. enterica serovar Enteritidis]